MNYCIKIQLKSQTVQLKSKNENEMIRVAINFLSLFNFMLNANTRHFHEQGLSVFVLFVWNSILHDFFLNCFNLKLIGKLYGLFMYILGLFYLVLDSNSFLLHICFVWILLQNKNDEEKQYRIVCENILCTFWFWNSIIWTHFLHICSYIILFLLFVCCLVHFAGFML